MSHKTISGNLISGVADALILGDDTGGDLVQGNLIGTDATGTRPIPNGGGVEVAHLFGSNNDLIGGTTPGAGNTIAYNNGPGVKVSIESTGAAVKGNAIYGNSGLGIDLGESGVPVLNDSLGHVGANDYQNFPVLNSATSSGTSTVVTGTFTEAAEQNKTLTLDFYANTMPDPTKDVNGVSGYGQGQTYLGSRTVYTDGSGNVSFNADFAVGNLANDWISATATDQSGNTSEFSLDVQATSAPSQTFAQNLAASLPQSPAPPAVNSMTVQVDPTTISDVLNGLAGLTSPLSYPVSFYLNLAHGKYSGQTVSVPAGMTLYINGSPNAQLPTNFDPAVPAFTLVSGNVVVSNVTFTETGDAPTILLTGGSLTLRNGIVQEPTGFTDAAIAIAGGTLDLGTAASPGGNIINVNGTGTFIPNTTANAVTAVGDTFEISGQVTAWPVPLTVTTRSSLMLVGNSPPPLTGFVNGTPFTGGITYTTAYGDQVTVTLSTTATSGSPVGQYAITAALSGASAGNYVIDPATSHDGTMYVVSLGADPSSTTGAESVVFWDNKGNKSLITAADLSALDALNLVTQGGTAFDPKAVAQLQTWLSTSPNATTSYQLAVQLAVMELNVLGGYVHATDLVYAGALLQYTSTYGITGLTSGGFINVQNLMNAANAILAVDPKALAGDPNQAYEAALTQVLQAANLDNYFVQQELLWNLVGLYPSLV